MTTTKLILAPLFCCLAACGAPSSVAKLNEAWNQDNDPLRMSGAYERNLGALPLTGRAGAQPWSDTYWPSYRGGIADRWQTRDNAFTYESPSQTAVQAMTPGQLARLSPAEKYDIFVGRYDYPTVRSERQRTSPTDATWEGICHGWSPAALNFAEPHAVLLTGQYGVAVPFGASDVKALLSYYQGQVAQAPVENVGDRCDADLDADPNAAHTPACRDTNAGAFHIVLANQLGVMKQGFVADVVRATQVWNQPVYSFTSQIVRTQAPSPGASPQTVSEAVVHTVMIYAEEVSPAWNPSNGTGRHADGSKAYDYRLELDSGGRIVGGEWLEADRPDFVWQQAAISFDGYYAALAGIEQHAVADPAYPKPGT